jgi:hypothetical protein
VSGSGVRSFGRTPGSRDCIKRGGGNPGQDGGYRDLSSRMWRSLVAHLFPKQEVTGPNPVIRSMDDTVQCELCDRDIPVATATVIPSIGYSCPPEDRTCQGHRREIMVRLFDLWDEYPDMRLGQLIGNVYRWDREFYSGTHIDPYQKNDEDFIAQMEQTYHRELPHMMPQSSS